MREFFFQLYLTDKTKVREWFWMIYQCPVPIEIPNYAIEICKIVCHDDLVLKPDSGLPNSHAPPRNSHESLED